MLFKVPKWIGVPLLYHVHQKIRNHFLMDMDNDKAWDPRQ